jgi:hypothetical protein
MTTRSRRKSKKIDWRYVIGIAFTVIGAAWAVYLFFFKTYDVCIADSAGRCAPQIVHVGCGGDYANWLKATCWWKLSDKEIGGRREGACGVSRRIVSCIRKF